MLGESRIFLSALLLDVDPELLSFLVEMAALESERFGRICDVVAVTLELRKNNIPLKLLYAIGQRA